MALFVTSNEGGRLTLNLSFLAVFPPPPNNPADVPLMEMTTVELSSLAN